MLCVDRFEINIKNVSPNETFPKDYIFAGFYVAPTLYRLYGNFPVLLVEEDFWCPSVHYFMQERVPDQNQRRSIS